MIYKREARQNRLDELCGVLDSDAVDKIAESLDWASKDRSAAIWELVMLHGLSKCGTLQHEVALSSQRRLDILSESGAILLITDVTAASDERLDNEKALEFTIDKLLDYMEKASAAYENPTRLASGP